MKKYIGKRIISFLIVLVGVSILSFLLIAWSGKDPAEIIAHRGVSNPTPEQIEMIRVEMGLDQPLPVRYIQWLSGMFTGELGTSLTTHQPIVKDLHKYLATTTSLVGMAILWIIVLTVPISLLCARKRNRLFDQVTRGITICGICVPTFWLGFLLLLFFAIHLKWFSVLPSPSWRGFLLPSFALAVPSSCSLIRIMRSSLLAELSACCYNFLSAIRLSNCRRGGNRKCFFNQGNRNLSGGQCDCSRYDCSFYLYSRHCGNFCRRKFHGRHNQPSALSMDGEGRK